ncbi:MAG: hypothetical protein ACR2G0_11285, partial [Chthoniobacterales bacterium]
QGRATMLLKLITGSTHQARHESWKKRQFEAPSNGGSGTSKPAQQTQSVATEEGVPAAKIA